MSGRVWTVGGLAVAGGVGYYLYSAGGDPKVAQKKAEADAHKVSAQLKSNIPGQADRAKKDAELGAQQVGAKFDSYAKQAQAETQKAEAKLSEYSADAQKKLQEASKSTGNAMNNAVDKFDKSVTDGASKAKSGISSWFGGK